MGSVGNLKTEGNKGNNFPFQLGALQALGLISTSVAGAATEATLLQVLVALQDGQEFEQNMVMDLGGVGCPAACPTYLQVRIFNSGTGTFDPPIYYDAAANLVVPVGPLQLVNPQYVLESVLLQLISINTILTGGARSGSVVNALIDGATTAGVRSVSLWFRGTNGTLGGVPVPNGAVFSYSTDSENDTLNAITYTVPTTGEARIIITYVS